MKNVFHGGDDNDEFNFVKVNKSQKFDSKTLHSRFNKVISHDSFAHPNSRYGGISPKTKKVRKLLDVYRSTNEIPSQIEENNSYLKEKQSLHKINDIFTPPKLLHPGLNLRNSYNHRLRSNEQKLYTPNHEHKRMFLRRGDRNKVMAVNMINNVQKMEFIDS